MPLIDIWKADKSSVLQMTIEQIASIAGDGKLADNSICQTELRHYLNEASTDSLAEYANYCLENSFTKSGQVLQDVINELGRRLEYVVENGRYQGVKNAIGFDGIWMDDVQWSLIVEVKTTDAYRLSLDTIAQYRASLVKQGRITESSSILIVVGRTDTGELEAQVRGSKHAWHVRIIGIDSLIQLVRVKESTDSQDTIRKIRTLLVPVEYTRIDELVGVVFAATKDVEDSSGEVVTDDAKANGKLTLSNDKTSLETISEIRDKIISATSSTAGESLIKKSRALYWSPNHEIRVACTISKRYNKQGVAKYWYAYHPSWDAFLDEGISSFLALGCVDLDVAFLLPLKVVRAVLPNLNITEKDGGRYWHVKITEPVAGSYFLQVPLPGSDLSLLEYQVSVS
jgi:hypothetical protein